MLEGIYDTWVFNKCSTYVGREEVPGHDLLECPRFLEAQ